MSAVAGRMTSAWSYEDRRAVVSEGGGAGMGAAVVRELDGLGAEVHVIDLKEPPVPVAGYHQVDLSQPEAAAEAVGSIGGKVDALFNSPACPAAGSRTSTP